MGTGELWHRRMEDHTENVVEQSRVDLGQIFIYIYCFRLNGAVHLSRVPPAARSSDRGHMTTV